MRSLIWFRNDLRVRDNPAVNAALGDGEVIACFCITASQWRRHHHMSDWRLGLLLRSLCALRDDLLSLGIPLRVLSPPLFADVPSELARLSKALNISRVHANAEYPLDERRRDQRVARALAAGGVAFDLHHGDAVVAPGGLLTTKGRPYTVFTPFYRRWRASIEERPLGQLPAPPAQPPIACRSDRIPERVGRGFL